MTPLDRLIQQWRLSKAIRYIPRNSRVLDIGAAADGALYHRIRRLSVSYVGIDPDITHRATLPPSGTLLPGFFPTHLEHDEPFDAIVLLAVLEHIPTDKQQDFASQLASYLKPGGVLIITVPSAKVDAILSVLRRCRLIDGMSIEQHYGYDASHTKPLFERAGLSLVRHERFQLGLNNLYLFRKGHTVPLAQSSDFVKADTYRWPLLLATAMLACMATTYITHGIATLWRANDSDLHKRRVEQLYILRGQNPFDVSETFIAIANGLPLPSHPGRRSDICPDLGMYGPGGYPPWAFLLGFGLVYPGPIEYTKAIFILINICCLMATAVWAYTTARQHGKTAACFVACATLAMFANGSTLRLGQYGIIINVMLIAMLLAQAAKRPLVAGSAYAAAMLKPTTAALYGWMLLFRRDYMAMATATAVLLFSSLLIGTVVSTSPLEMLRQMLVQSNMWAQEGISPSAVLMAAGVPKAVASAAAAACGLVASGYLVHRCRNAPLIYSYAVLAIIGRIWSYHRQYDDVMLVFPLVLLLLIWLSSRRVGDLVVAVLFGITLWVPLRLVDLTPPVQIIMWLVWLTGLLMIVNVAESDAYVSRKAACASAS